jgi:hypothetical protein
MTIRGGGNPVLDMVCAPRFRMGPPPRNFAADAHDCIMVRICIGSTEYSVWREVPRPMASSPRIRPFSLFILPPRAQASRCCETQARLRRPAAKLR